MTAPTNLEEMVRILQENGFIVSKGHFPPSGLADAARYKPYVNEFATFAPWASDSFLSDLISDLLAAGAKTLLSADRLWILKSAMLQTSTLDGEVWELGVYQGGSALLLRRMLDQVGGNQKWRTMLRLFDTFEGMPEPDPQKDLHALGEFGDTSFEAVRRLVGIDPWIDYRVGRVPDTFAGLDKCKVRFAHLDMDIYESTIEACRFVYPRLVPGGIAVFDDYGFWSCPGARAAVDEFFSDKREMPFVLPTASALVVKLP